MAKELIFILGGARSGKSSFAERIAGQSDSVLFVATAQAWDDDMKQRIAAHQSSRSDTWDTLEEPVSLVPAMRPKVSNHETVLLDCLTLWVSNMLLENEESPDIEKQILASTEDLLALYEEGTATWIIVTNEVGLGIVPPSSLGRVYRDILGKVNQLVASRADKVYLMSAGLALELKSLGAQPFDKIIFDTFGQ